MTPAPSLPHPRQRWRAPGGPLQALFAACVLGLVSFAFVGQSRDFENYAEYFAEARTVALRSGALLIEQRFEPVFAVLASALAPLFSDVSALALLAALAFFLKWGALARLSAGRLAFWGALVFYLVRFAPLHELTQIRLAIAMGLWMLALTQVRRPAFWLLLLLFPLTHYSTLVLVPLTWAWRMLVLRPEAYQRVERLVWPSALGCVVAVGILMETVLQPLAALFSILDFYANTGFGEDKVNVFNVPTLLNMGFWLLFVTLRKSTPAQRFWLWTQLLAFCIFFAARDFPVIAHRMNEMLSLAWVIYLANTLSLRGRRGQLARAFLVLAVPLYLYVYALSANAVLSL
jgi:hypothetical protein